MDQNPLSTRQRRAGYGLLALISAGLVWAACPDLPSWRAFRQSSWENRLATNGDDRQDLPLGPIARREDLGASPRVRSCVDCHSQGGGGGGGLNQPEVIVLEPRQRMRAFPPQAAVQPGSAGLRPVSASTILTSSRVVMERRALVEDVEPTRPGTVNPLALFGLDLVDRIPGRAIERSRLHDPVAGLVPGRPHVLADGRVGKFGWKAQFATLEEFVAAGCARAVGPAARGGGLVPSPLEFIETLRRPDAIPPDSAADADAARRGQAQFAAVGCVACHTPEVGGLREVYGDFLLHRLNDRGLAEAPRVLPPTADPLPDEWRTPPLWGVADSAPYLHDGSAPTLEAAIARHRGDAAPVTRAYDNLTEADRGDLIAFLRTLRAPAVVAPPAVDVVEERPRLRKLMRATPRRIEG